MMRSHCNPHSSPVKSCAKWLILSLAFVWLVGCAAMKERKISKRDPFAAEKFSCGEDIPRGRAKAPVSNSIPLNNAMTGRNVNTPQRNPAYGNPDYGNPTYTNPAQSNVAYGNPAYANPAYSQPSYANPAYSNQAYANPAQGHPGYANTAGRKSSSAKAATANAATVNTAEFDADEANATATRTAEATPEFGMSPARGAAAEFGATPAAYEIPASKEANSNNAAGQANWYDSDK